MIPPRDINPLKTNLESPLGFKPSANWERPRIDARQLFHLWGWVVDVTAWWCWSKVFLAKIFKIDLLYKSRLADFSLLVSISDVRTRLPVAMILKGQWKQLWAIRHDVIPRLLPLQVLVLQFQLGNVGLVMGQHLLVKLMGGLQLVLQLGDPALHVFHLDPPLMLVEGQACAGNFHDVAGSHPRHQKLLLRLGRSQDHPRHLPFTLSARARGGRRSQVGLAS